MAENKLLERLDSLVAKHKETELLITDPSVIADMRRFVRLNKEYKELSLLMEARKQYLNLINTRDEARVMMSQETDPELKELAREEFERCNIQIPETEEQIKLLLIPADPEDDKNVIMEIRGG
ncbi:MAG: PCRF domain-containing protein, partial [Bacteroidaceae bacterium]|nr:PCRF domain-containing protein [Bacteroidaceae bacterium]